MKNKKVVIYWIATALLSFGMLVSGVQQVLRTKPMLELISPLGYPSYFLVILGVWKVLGVVAVLAPGSRRLKEWAYAGFFFAMTGALASHLAIGDYGIAAIIGPIMQTVFIVLSWYLRPENRKMTATHP